jgi:hypothetical protein
MPVQELGELANLEAHELEILMRDALRRMIIIAEAQAFSRLPALNQEFQRYRVAYCKTIGKDEETADTWDMARNKVITYWNYALNDIPPVYRVLSDAKLLAGIKAA